LSCIWKAATLLVEELEKGFFGGRGWVLVLHELLKLLIISEVAL
jgi:hypothetical protein